MAPKLFFPPSLKAAYVFSPLASSSLTLSLEIIIESTAIPTPNTRAAIPVNVSTPPTALNIINTNNAYINKQTLPIKPLILYLNININEIRANVINPAIPVFVIVSAPNDGETLFGVASSLNLVGSEPLLIKSTKFAASS